MKLWPFSKKNAASPEHPTPGMMDLPPGVKLDFSELKPQAAPMADPSANARPANPNSHGVFPPGAASPAPAANLQEAWFFDAAPTSLSPAMQNSKDGGEFNPDPLPLAPDADLLGPSVPAIDPSLDLDLLAPPPESPEAECTMALASLNGGEPVSMRMESPQAAAPPAWTPEEDVLPTYDFRPADPAQPILNDRAHLGSLLPENSPSPDPSLAFDWPEITDLSAVSSGETFFSPSSQETWETSPEPWTTAAPAGNQTTPGFHDFIAPAPVDSAESTVSFPISNSTEAPFPMASELSPSDAHSPQAFSDFAGGSAAEQAGWLSDQAFTPPTWEEPFSASPSSEATSFEASGWAHPAESEVTPEVRYAADDLNAWLNPSAEGQEFQQQPPQPQPQTGLWQEQASPAAQPLEIQPAPSSDWLPDTTSHPAIQESSWEDIPAEPWEAIPELPALPEQHQAGLWQEQASLAEHPLEIQPAPSSDWLPDSADSQAAPSVESQGLWPEIPAEMPLSGTPQAAQASRLNILPVHAHPINTPQPKKLVEPVRQVSAVDNPEPANEKPDTSQMRPDPLSEPGLEPLPEALTSAPIDLAISTPLEKSLPTDHANVVQETASAKPAAHPAGEPAVLPHAPVAAHEAQKPEPSLTKPAKPGSALRSVLEQPTFRKPTAPRRPVAPIPPEERPRPYKDSFADEMQSFEHEILLQDSRFLSKSINRLVEQYFSQPEEPESPW